MSPPTKEIDLPRGLEHQAATVVAISAVFSLAPEPFDALRRGGSRVLEKLIRTYHYWVDEYEGKGICPYDHPRCGYFRSSRDADEAPKNESMHREHAVPIGVLVDALCDARNREGNVVSTTSVERIMRANEIVVITKDQAKLLDKQYKYKMPENWIITEKSHLARLELVLGIKESDLVGKRLIGPDHNKRGRAPMALP